MISGVATSIGRPERGASHVDIRPRLNSFTQLYTAANAGADVLFLYIYVIGRLNCFNIDFI